MTSAPNNGWMLGSDVADAVAIGNTHLLNEIKKVNIVGANIEEFWMKFSSKSLKLKPNLTGYSGLARQYLC